MSSQDELVARFIEISGGDENVAKFYLSSSKWSLEEAVANFYAHQNENEGESPRDMPMVDDDNSMEEARTGLNAPVKGATGAENFGSSSSTKPKFATLNDMSKRTADEEEGQAFYAGGSERSGQQVLGPPKRKNFREQLSEMFRMAQQEQGAGIDSAPTPSTSANSGAGGSSWGQGVRLGMTDNDHAVVVKPDQNRGGEKKPVVVLKLWSQGFSVDDGELRHYDDPQNKEFLETVMRGEIPNELLEMGWMVNVDVEDHRHEDYKKTTLKQTFKGSGHTLGSPTPNVEAPIASVSNVGSAQSVSSANAVSSAEDEKEAKEKLKVDTAAPVTTLQIRLADGSRLAAQFNLSHTVADIQQYIRNARPQYVDSNFILVSSFPTRELTDNSATIESAGLKNAAIMQRLK